MTALEFATLVHESFVARGWTKSSLSQGPYPTAHLDTWSFQNGDDRCTAARAESQVCRLVRDHKVDPKQVRFSVTNGHLLVQLRDDHDEHSLTLADRSTWKRLKKS
jgi:hypothetical protein